MDGDMIERAEAERPRCPRGLPWGMVDELIAELKSARASEERMKGDCNRKERPCGVAPW